MKKAELLQLHALFDEIRRQVASDADPSAFQRYDSLDVSARAVYLPKARHREAVVELSCALADELATKGKYGSSEGVPESAMQSS